MRLPQQRAEHGFTLIEVLIALAVIGIGLLAVLAVAAKSARVAADIQDRAFADWVAENHIAELRLSEQWPQVGDSDGDTKLAGRKWHWKTTVDATPDKDLRRATVTVAAADRPDDELARFVAFIGKPMAVPAGPPSGASALSPMSNAQSGSRTLPKSGPP